MMIIDKNKTVAELVLESPALVSLFEDYGIDYCCGGKKTLIEASEQKGLILEDIISSLEEKLQNSVHDAVDPKLEDSFSFIIEHLLNKYHEPTKDLLVQVLEQGAKVAKVHGHKDAKLISLSEKIIEIFNELIPHMEKEEKVLFPYLLQLDGADSVPEMHCGSVRNPITVMEREHDHAGTLLKQIQELAGDFLPPEEACNTHQVLLKNLNSLQRETHRHIHIENNILFPKALGFLDKFKA